MDRIQQLLLLYQDDQSDPFTLFALGFEYHKRGRLEDALKWYKSILATAPAYTGVYYHLGKLYLELGNQDDAVRTYREGIQACNDLHEVKDRAELQQALMEVDDD
jgi:tetratricopeptide (TPR) repeat protein